MNAQYTTANDGDWDDPATWVGSVLPTLGADIIINHDVNFNVTSEYRANTILVNSGGSLTDINVGYPRLVISINGSIENNGTFDFDQGIVVFWGAADVIGTERRDFNDVELQNVGGDIGVDFGTQSHVSGELAITSSSFVDVGSPIYENGSTLTYASNSDYNRRSEWSNTAGPQGDPENVIIRNSNLNLGSENPGNPAVMNGNLTIEPGGSIYMDVGSGPGSDDMEHPLIVGGNFINEGTIILSDLPGGDLVVEGDFTDSGTINYNNRAIFFEGSNDQQLIGDASGGAYFMDVVRVDKPSGEVFLNQDTEINKTLDPLTLSNEGILNINGFNLILGEPGTASQITFNGNSALKGSDTSTLTLKGSGSMGNLVFDDSNDGVTNVIGNIFLEKDAGSTVGLSNNLYLKESITLEEGVLESNGHLVFLSDENRTAVIRPAFDGTFNGTITGDVIIHRHFPLTGFQRSFRYISPSVTTTTSIHANWQEGAMTGNFIPNEFGTHITGAQGPVGQVSAEGFDMTETGNNSLFTWDEINQQWSPVTSTIDDPATTGTVENTLDVEDAFALMVRGDRSSTLTSNTDEGTHPATIRTTGLLDLTDFTYNFSAPYDAMDPNEFVLVGNPYQAQVDMIDVLADVATTGISPNYLWVWDPTLTDKGAYAVVDLSDPDNPEDIDGLPSSSQANQYLQPFQAVFVQVNAGPSQTVEFQRDDIDNSEAQTTVFSTSNTSKIEIELYNSQNSLLLDAARLQFGSNYNNAKTFEDAAKFWNYDEALAIVNDDSYISIDKRKLPDANDTIPLYLGNYQTNPYTLKLNSSLDNNTQVQLYDHYLQQAVDINSGANAYNFTVDPNIPESTDAERFVLVFNPQTLSTTSSPEPGRFSVYPNPTRDVIHIRVSDAHVGNQAQMSCFDVLGRQVLSQHLLNLKSTTSFDLSGLTSGIYLLKLDTPTHKQSFKIRLE